MTSFQLGYRHENGEVEGFLGTAFTGEEAAKADAIRNVRAKVESIGQTFDNARLILSGKGLLPGEKASIEADWSRLRGKGILATRKDMLG